MRAYMGFGAIFIVIFGIYSGIFSPTEAAAITVAFCLLLGSFLRVNSTGGSYLISCFDRVN